MNDFSGRVQHILKILLRQKEIVSVNFLADQLQVSKRTVQRELEYIDRPLSKYRLKFCSKAGAGVWLEGSDSDRCALLSLLEAEDSLDASDKTQRRKRLTLEILKDKEVKKLYYYGELFGVSEATISGDLESLTEWLGRFGLTVVKKQGMGISMDGSESGFRQALRAFIDENLNTAVIREQYEEDRDVQLLSLAGSHGEKNIYQVLDVEIMKRVMAGLSRIPDRRIRNLTDQSYRGLVIHVTIAINRICKQEILEENPALLVSMERDEDYHLAEAVTRQLEREFSIVIPDTETAYICLHIKGAKVQQIDMDETAYGVMEEYRSLLETVHQMIERFDPDQSYALKQDEEFVVQGLIAHLKPTLVRLANGMKIQNPLLEHIQTEYREIYTRCLKVAKVLEERYGYPVPDTEIGFLAIHFGAALVRLKNRKEVTRKVFIGVVCASGIGISRLMLSKLNREFLERAQIQAYGMYDLTPYVLEGLDFLIATLPVKEEIETLFVSPLLTGEEMQKIENRVRFYERMPARKQEKTSFSLELEKVNGLAARINVMIHEMGYLLVSPDMELEELLVAISEITSPYHDRQWMIQEDIRRRERLASQVFPELGFALFHTKTGGVSKPVFSVCRPKGDVHFQNSYFQGIRVVIVMLLPEDDLVRENREMLGFLSEMLVEEEAFLETLCTGEKEVVQEILSVYLKRFFRRYLERI